MACQKMTFTVPDELAQILLRRVPSRERSAYVSEAIAAKLREQDESLIRACEAANRDIDVSAIEQEWDSLQDCVLEPWQDAEAR
jgi:hypothetical protein